MKNYGFLAPVEIMNNMAASISEGSRAILEREYQGLWERRRQMVMFNTKGLRPREVSMIHSDNADSYVLALYMELRSKMELIGHPNMRFIANPCAIKYPYRVVTDIMVIGPDAFKTAAQDIRATFYSMNNNDDGMDILN